MDYALEYIPHSVSVSLFLQNFYCNALVDVNGLSVIFSIVPRIILVVFPDVENASLSIWSQSVIYVIVDMALFMMVTIVPVLRFLTN